MPELIVLIIVIIIALIVIGMVALLQSNFLKNKIGVPKTKKPTTKKIICRKISQLAEVLSVSHEKNEDANAILDKIMLAVSQISEDRSVLSQRNGEYLAELEAKRQKYEQLEKECSDLKKHQELYKQFYLKALNADKDEDKKFILLKEVERCGYAVRAIRAIQNICATISNSTDYDSLKTQVNRILFELDQYEKNLGEK